MRASRDLSTRTDTPQGVKQIIPGAGTWELADATTAAEFDFFIPDNAVILNAGLRLKIRPWRSFEKDVSSGGGTTTSAGGASAPTTATQAAHSHKMFDFDAVTPQGMDTHKFLCNTSLGADAFADLAASATDLWTRSANGLHSHGVTIASHQHSAPNHVHSVVKGVHVEASYPGAVSISLDGVDVSSVIGAPFTASASNDVFEASLPLTSPGWHSLTADLASGLGRIQAFVITEALVLG